MKVVTAWGMQNQGWFRFLSRVKKELKCTLGQQGLEKEAGLWGTLPSSLSPSPHQLLGKLDSGCQGAAGEVESEHRGHSEIKCQSSLGPGSPLGLQCRFTWHQAERRGRQVSHAEGIAALTGLGLHIFLPSQLPGRHFALYLLGVSLLDHFSKTKALLP